MSDTAANNSSNDCSSASPSKSKRSRKNRNNRRRKNNNNNANNKPTVNSSDDRDDAKSNDEVPEEQQQQQQANDNNNNNNNESGERKEDVGSCDEMQNVPPSFETLSDIQMKSVVEVYTVESPQNTLKPAEKERKKKLQHVPKSKSLDNEDDNVLNIVEIDVKSSDEDKSLVENNAVITEAESDVEWETTDALKHASGDDVDKDNDKSDNNNDKDVVDGGASSQSETDLRQFLKSLNLGNSPQEVKPIPEVKIKPSEDFKEPVREPSVNDMKLRKAQKKAALEEYCIAQYLRPRFLDIIDEEGSADSSDTNRRDSTLSDRSSKFIDDLEDDVFIVEKKVKEPLEYFPKHKDYLTCKKDLKRQQECKLVGAKIIESELEGGCGTWTLESTESQRGAEIVYLDDSSSSTSENTEGTDVDVEAETFDTDERVNIKTPIIELNAQYDADLNGIIIPLMSNVDFNYKSADDGSCATKADAESSKSISLQTVPITPESAFATNEELIESLENLLVNAPTPVACNEVIMLSNEFVVDELPIVTEVLKESKSSHGNDESSNPTPFDDPSTVNLVAVDENNVDNLSSSCTSGEESGSKDNYSRQDSSSSVCSSSHSTSHSTAKYNPLSSSLTDIDALVHDDLVASAVSKKDTSLSPTGSKLINTSETVTGDEVERDKTPSPLKELCLGRIASLPYGSVVLKELAAVSQSLSDFASEALSKKMGDVMQIPRQPSPEPPRKVIYKPKLPPALHLEKTPPPVAPRQSSFKLLHEEPAASWVGLQSQRDPALVAYLSPMQKKQIETTKNYSSDEAGELIDMHRKYAERRGYNDETFANSEKEPSASNNNDDKIAVQVERPAPDTGNRLLAIIRDPSVNPNVQQSDAPMQNDPIESSFDFMETLRTFEDMNKDLSNDQRFRSWTKKEGNVKESFEIAENLSTDKCFRATSKQGNVDATDFTLKTIKENIVLDKDPKTNHADIVTNGAVESSKPRERIVKIAVEDNVKTTLDNAQNDAKTAFQSLVNRREFLLDDPIFKNEIFSNKTRAFASSQPRRGSLPKDIHDRQIEYIIQKEKEIQEQIRQLEEEKKLAKFESARTVTESTTSFSSSNNNNNTTNNTVKESERSITVNGKQTLFESSKESQNLKTGKLITNLASAPSEGERFREQMYCEYMDKVAQREERKQNRVIKISNSPSTSMNNINIETIIPIIYEKTNTNENVKRNAGSEIEEEFINRAKERWDKLGFKDPETVDTDNGPVVIEHKIKVLDGEGEKDMKKLPTHLQEFVEFTSNGDQSGECGAKVPKRSIPSLFVICPIVVVLLAVVKRFWAFETNTP